MPLTKSEQSELAVFFQQNDLSPYFFKFLKNNISLSEIQSEKDLSDFSSYFGNNLCDYLSFVSAVNEKNLPNNQQESVNESSPEGENLGENLGENHLSETTQRPNTDEFENQTESRKRKLGVIHCLEVLELKRDDFKNKSMNYKVEKIRSFIDSK